MGDLPTSAPSPLIKPKPKQGFLRSLATRALFDPKAGHAIAEGFKRGMLLDNPVVSGLDLAGDAGLYLAKKVFGADNSFLGNVPEGRLAAGPLKDVAEQVGLLDPKYDAPVDPNSEDEVANHFLGSTGRLAGGLLGFGVGGLRSIRGLQEAAPAILKRVAE